MSNIKEINIAREFYHRLANRDSYQGDGKHTAKDFREKYLSELDNKESWKNNEPFIVIDFLGVTKLGPSFANEAFGYFTQYANPKQIKNKIIFRNISNVKKAIIENELRSGYRR